MYKLTRISLINWYLVDAKDIDIRDATAFIGPVGAGKSSISDAVQTVMCGGSHNHIHLNASSTGNKREIIDYCLGYLVPKADGGEPIRQSCDTILALVFTEERRDGSRHDITVGLAMSARAGDHREAIYMRFIAPGYRFSVADATGIDDQGKYVKAWEQVEKEIRAACPKMQAHRHNAEKFVESMLAEMRPRGRQPDKRRFLHAFTNALQFKPISDPTQFVRHYILEADMLDIDGVRSSIGRWKFLAQAVRQIEAKLQRLTTVRRRYDDWGALLIERASNHWGRACASTERGRVELRRLGRARDEANINLKTQETIVSQLERAWDEGQRDLNELKATFALRDSEGKVKEFEREIKDAQRDMKGLEGINGEVRRAIRMAVNISAISDYLPASTRALIAETQAVQALLTETGIDWLHDKASQVKTGLARLTALRDLPLRLQPQIEDKERELAKLRDARDLAEGNAKRVRGGSRPLSDYTGKYLDLLRKHGISAEVLCNVVQPVDKEWQFAAEALLGLFREAVIVDPKHLAEANELLFANRNRDGLHRIRLVKTTRTGIDHDRLPPDSLANVLTTDNPHALAVIRGHLGGVKMVRTKEELENASRAIMRDGRATAGLAFSVNQDLTLILGRQDASLAEELEAKAAGIRGEIAVLQRVVDGLKQASLAAEALSGLEIDIETAAFDYEECRRRISDAERRKKSAMSEEDVALAEEIKTAETELRERKKEIDEARNSKELAVRVAERADGAWDRGRQMLRAAVRSKRLALAALSDENLIVAQKWAPAGGRAPMTAPANPYLAQRLEDLAAAKYDAIIQTHDEALDKIDDRVNKAANGARKVLDDYLRDYTIDRPIRDESPYCHDYNWVVLNQITLESNELREHRDLTEAAEREMYRSLKEDLLVNLNGRFQKMEAQLKTMNVHLRKHPITGQIYKFAKKPDSRYDRLRRLAIEVANNPDSAQALIEGRTNDLAMKAAMDELNEYLDATQGEGMEDYRNYFVFDLLMRDAKKDSADDDDIEIDAEKIKQKGWMTLSGRGGVSSGGEGEAPFYVAIAASMALCYYPGGGVEEERSGMGLVMFDEVFKKFDIVTTQKLVRFYKDLGLQLVMAAPEEKRPTFTEVLDTIVSVNKDLVNQIVQLDVEHPTPYAKEQMAAINPDHVGIDGFRARLAEPVDA